jgi:hypothetical protein
MKMMVVFWFYVGNGSFGIVFKAGEKRVSLGGKNVAEVVVFRMNFKDVCYFEREVLFNL